MKIFEIISINPLLNKALNWIIENNTSNFLPYHNLYHLLTVTENCNEGANYYHLSEKERTSLLLAALFHDVNYVSDKTWKDAQKISLAIQALHAFGETTAIPEAIHWDEIEAIIWATEFPHKEIHKLPISHQIIQDADLMQVFAPNAFIQVVMGLSQEMEIGISDMLNRQKDFVYNIVWNTQWARLVFEENIRNFENNIELWKRLYL